jgi:hypothetical protein
MYETIIKEKIRHSPNGTECTFVKISDKIGAKVYKEYSSDEVRKIYKEQEYAATKGLGPDVHGLFSVKVNGKVLFGYLTEIVKVFPCKNSHGELVETRNPTKQENNELDQLICELDQAAINRGVIEDLHFCNIGWKNGKMICVDFGYLE